jgi:outer membrane murein-binding lipoprotein Lpp
MQFRAPAESGEEALPGELYILEGKMNRKKWHIFAFMLAGVLLSACSGMNEQRINELTGANVELRKQVIRLDQANKEKEKALSERQEDISRLEAEKTRLNSQITNLNTELEKLKSAPPSESTVLKQKPESAETRTANVASAKTSNIKILAGLSRMPMARVFASKLTATGYRVERVDQAPRSFEKTTVYYASGYENEARDIARRIGKDIAIKPITWNSAFRIIVAVGKK